MYLNALICILIAVFTFYTSYYIFKTNRTNMQDFSYAFFWLLVSATWFFVFVSIFLYKNGLIEYDILLNQYLIQTFIFGQMVAGSYFAAFRGTRNHFFAAFIFFFLLTISIIGLAYDYQPGSLYPIKNTFISVEYKIDDTAWAIFQIIFSFVMIGMVVDLLRNLYYWFKNNSLFEQKYFFACLAALIYGTVGYFDQEGIFASWIGVLFRVSIIFCANIAYFAYSEKEI